MLDYLCCTICIFQYKYGLDEYTKGTQTVHATPLNRLDVKKKQDNCKGANTN